MGAAPGARRRRAGADVPRLGRALKKTCLHYSPASGPPRVERNDALRELNTRHRQPRPRRRGDVVAARAQPERRDARERVVGEALGVEERGDDGVLRRHGGRELAERGVLVLAQRDELRRRAEVEDLDLRLLRRAERRLGADRRACA